MIRTLLATCVFLGITSFTYAQSTPTGFERDLNLTITPAHPGPGQTVRLSVQTYGLDLNRSAVTWYANDREIARGVGTTQTDVTVGGLGSETKILVVAEDEEGITASAEAILRPTEVDLLWEADSYVHPFYAGRALPGTNSLVHAQALARFKTRDGKTVPNSDIVYTWYNNDAVVSEGRGKSSITLQGPTLFGTNSLRVIAASADRTLSGEASALLPSTDPFVMLYENHPLFGVLYHRSIEPGAATREVEQKVTAVPYFAGIRSPREAGLSYAWSVNGAPIEPNPQEPQTLTIAASGYSGPVDITLELTNMSDVLMRSTGVWQLVFGEQSSFGFFTGLNPFGGE